jgi:hypothetical protein
MIFVAREKAICCARRSHMDTEHKFEDGMRMPNSRRGHPQTRPTESTSLEPVCHWTGGRGAARKNHRCSRMPPARIGLVGEANGRVAGQSGGKAEGARARFIRHNTIALFTSARMNWRNGSTLPLTGTMTLRECSLYLERFGSASCEAEGVSRAKRRRLAPVQLARVFELACTRFG